MNSGSLEILEKAELPPPHAHAILRAMELEIATAGNSLATRADLAATRADLMFEIEKLRMELRTEFRTGLAQTEAKLMRWTFTCFLTSFLGQAGIMAGTSYFLLEHFKR